MQVWLLASLPQNAFHAPARVPKHADVKDVVVIENRRPRRQGVAKARVFEAKWPVFGGGPHAGESVRGCRNRDPEADIRQPQLVRLRPPPVHPFQWALMLAREE